MSNTLNEISQSSSVGAIWPPMAGSQERIRGFYDRGIVETAEGCRDFAQLYLNEQSEFEHQTEYTRLSMRFVTYIAHLRILEQLGVEIEAALPLATSDETMVLVYAGRNSLARTLSPNTIRCHRRLLKGVVSQDQTSPHTPADYEEHMIDHSTAPEERQLLVSRFVGMYGIFGYDQTDVTELLMNPDNTIAYFQDDNGEVVSTAMAEHATVAINGFGDLKLVEITEACTRPELRGQGLYRAISGLLTNQLLNLQASNPVHTIYGESNLAMPGVLFAGHENGRRFSFFDRERFRIESERFGILPQNFSVQDDTEQRAYNDFALSYIPLQSMKGSL